MCVETLAARKRPSLTVTVVIYVTFRLLYLAIVTTFEQLKQFRTDPGCRGARLVKIRTVPVLIDGVF